MTPHDLHHFLAVRRAAGGGIDDIGSFAEIYGAHDCGGYNDKLFRILAAKVVESVCSFDIADKHRAIHNVANLLR